MSPDEPKPPLLIAVMGPTATGKSKLAEELAERLDAVLINADAFQVYRGMDIGTAKPANKAKYKLLDLKEPNEGFGLGEWLKLVEHELSDAYSRLQNVVVVGGTGLYIRGLMEEYAEIWPPPDPELRQNLEHRKETEGLDALYRELRELESVLAERTDPMNPARVLRALERALSKAKPQKVQIPLFHQIKISLDANLDELYAKIEFRAKQMVQNGWLAEVEELANLGYGPGDPGFRALGYGDLWRHLKGEITIEEAITNLIQATKRYGRRQRTWLRSEPRLKVFHAGTETHLIWQWIYDSRGVN